MVGQALAVCRGGSPWGRIAQLVEQLTLNQRVQGSSPCAPTKNQVGVYGFSNLPARRSRPVPTSRSRGPAADRTGKNKRHFDRLGRQAERTPDRPLANSLILLRVSHMDRFRHNEIGQDTGPEGPFWDFERKNKNCAWAQNGWRQGAAAGGKPPTPRLGMRAHNGQRSAGHSDGAADTSSQPLHLITCQRSSIPFTKFGVPGVPVFHAPIRHAISMH